jgi:hypothetical protein
MTAQFTANAGPSDFGNEALCLSAADLCAFDAERQDTVEQVGIFQAVMFGRLGEFLALGYLGIGIGLDEVWRAVVRQPKIDAGVTVKLQRSADALDQAVDAGLKLRG